MRPMNNNLNKNLNQEYKHLEMLSAQYQAESKG